MQRSLLCPHQVNTTRRAIDKYIRGLPLVVRDAVDSAEPDTLEKIFRLTTKFSHN
ncbi:hypothetical protein Hanom_Chr07g00639521 [Helianthus anomalus]